MSKLLAGRYELVEKIGEGGMAVVYKSKDRLLNRYVAIKILRPEYTSDEQFVESFKNESQAAAGLQHPNIVAVYDVGKSGNINYIVMELIEGRPLSEIISEKGSLDYKFTIEVAKQMASALSLAHKHRIIHRDVKPHNILITESGTAKLTDFGIAKAVSSSTMVAETSKIIGSVHYFSPEQARGSYVDERSDIYSLGIVMYEMLTGRVPFDGESPVEVALKHINEEIIPPSKLAKNIPPSLEKIILKATDKYQANRYRNADELHEDLINIEFLTQMLGEKVLAGGSSGRSVSISADDKEKTSVVKKTPEKEAASVSTPRVRKPSAEGNDAEKKKKKRMYMILGAAGVILLIALLLLVPRILRAGSEVKLPSLENKSYEEAKKELEALGLKIEKEKEPVASAEIKEGNIVSQAPVAGTMVKKGRTIRVVLSSGNTQLKVPDLKGRTYEEAKQLLKGMGLKISKGETVESSTIGEGKIAEQFPGSGSDIEKGDIVTVNLSSGMSKSVVVKVVDRKFVDEEEIRKHLEKYGYNLGSVTFEETRSKEPGYIISQNPAPGETAPKGTAIDIVVSKKKATDLVPDVVTRNQEDAQAVLESKGFALGKVNTEEVDDDAKVGTVLRQFPTAGSDYELGSTVNIWIGVKKEASNVEVPNVMNQTEENAVNMLKEKGFVPKVSHEKASDEQEGLVIRQNPDVGTLMEKGSTVEIWIGTK